MEDQNFNTGGAQREHGVRQTEHVKKERVSALLAEAKVVLLGMASRFDGTRTYLFYFFLDFLCEKP
jgi:hypothetical protein